MRRQQEIQKRFFNKYFTVTEFKVELIYFIEMYDNGINGLERAEVCLSRKRKGARVERRWSDVVTRAATAHPTIQGHRG